MKVKVISILEDNYMYLIIEENTRHAVAVDAAVSKRVNLGWEWAFRKISSDAVLAQMILVHVASVELGL